MPIAYASLRQDGERLAAPLPPLVAEAERVAAAVTLGVHGKRRPGLGETFWEYRRHRPEDGAERVDWRRSARSEHLFVRENEREVAQTVLLWRDGREGMQVKGPKGRPSKRDRASVLAIALASLLTRGGERVAVIGESQMPRTGRSGFARVAMRLAEGPGDPSGLTPIHAPRFARLVLASDFYEPLDAWRARLAPLAAAGGGGALVQVVDPEEEEFPFKGRMLFLPSGGGRERLFGRVETVAAGYRERFLRHREGLVALARGLGWTFTTTRTDQPATPALLALHRAIAPARHRT